MAPPSKRTPPEHYTVLSQTQQQLADLGAAEQQPALHALALHLSRVIDETVAARDTASLARELRATLAELRALVEVPEEKTDGVDDLESRRAARRAAAASS